MEGEIISKLNKDINIALASSEIKAQLAEMQASPLGGTPRDFGKPIERELKKWSKLVNTNQVGVHP
jgi:tripartite-type tricarboxylate transporter receptor subunit TctC